MSRIKAKKEETTDPARNGNGHAPEVAVVTTTPVVTALAPRPASEKTTKSTVASGPAGPESVYDDAVKEIVSLAENDGYARRIDNGPLSEARGKDTWSLHTQLRALDQLQKQIGGVRATLQVLDEARGRDNKATLGLVEKYGTATSEEMVKLTRSTDQFLAELRQETERQLNQFRDEALRLIDKRFNQADVSFASIRAEQEILKALVTDIIKDRIGRVEKQHR